MSDQMPDLGWTTNGRVSRVLDGDTVEVEVTRKFVVRLRDCWAPEMESKTVLADWRRDWKRPAGSGYASYCHLGKLADGMRVRLHVIGSPDEDFRDVTTMGRVVGDVWLLKDGTNLAAAQVAAGHATKERPK